MYMCSPKMDSLYSINKTLRRKNLHNFLEVFKRIVQQKKYNQKSLLILYTNLKRKYLLGKLALMYSFSPLQSM